VGKTLLVILGPTAIGKTDLSIKLAQHYQTEIISSDSRQFYSELNIGVARPSPTELFAIPHHFIGFLPITEEFSAGMFARRALEKLEELFETHDYVVCSGGSMLYIDALINGLDELPSDKETRKKIIGYYQQYGLEFIQKQIQELDPEYSEIADLSNPHRVIRALEVCLVSGEKYSALRKDVKQERVFKTIKIGLNTSREKLYNRINRRVDRMLEEGLLEEAKSLFAQRSLNSLNTVGYKELFSFFEGTINREEAIDQIKQHSRNYAKRQLTWWKRDEEITWFEISDSETLKTTVLEHLSTLIR
jgi:tRNA dimethylallyltransferase